MSALKELNQGPNDEDRLRFGFAKQRRPSQDQTGASSARAPAGLHRREASCSAILSARSSFNGAAWTSQTDCEVVSLVERLLGDRESSMASLLRMKSSAPKYDFKGRISELSEQNRVLRTAVLEHRESSKALIDALGPVQADISFRLRTAASDLSMARMQLRERSQLQEEVQEALRAVMREESGQAQTQASGGGDPAMRQEIERLNRILSMETARAERAESRVHDRDALVAGLREELEATRAEAKKHKELARESAQQAKLQVDEAAQLLSKQVKDAAENHRQMLIIAKQREESLIAELTRMAALVEVSTIAARVGEFELPEPNLETPTEASVWSDDVSLQG